MFVNEAVFILEQIAEHRLVPLYYFGLKNNDLAVLIKRL